MKRLFFILVLFLISININAQQPPVACFTADSIGSCSFNFIDLSLYNPWAWSWSFAGGTPSISTAQHPPVTYNTPGIYSVTLTVSNGFGNDTETKIGVINATTCYFDTTIGTPCTLTTGLQNLVIVDEPISIYPNPTTGQFTVSSRQGEKIKVYDLFGRLVLHTNKEQIDMRGFAKGVYVLRTGQVTRKIILQ